MTTFCDKDEEGVDGIPDVSPLDPVSGMFPQNIYERINNHPITSTNHTHANITTVVSTVTTVPTCLPTCYLGFLLRRNRYF